MATSRTIGVAALLGAFLAVSPVGADSVPAEAASPAPSMAEATAGAPAAEEATPQRLVYSVNRIPEPAFETARAVQVITADDARRRGARTLPEALMEEAGIFVQQTNYGGGSPIIRGMIGKQVLILIDGIKVNTATYRFGPLQYLATIDLATVDRIEIVRGVGSVLGSDAMGGVINIVTRKGPPTGSSPRLGGAVEGRFSSADRAHTEHAEIHGRGDRYRFLAGATYRAAGDLDAGGPLGRQQATGYDEAAGHANLEYFVSPERTLSVSFDLLDQDQVPRTDRVATGTNLVFDFDPQRLQLLTATYHDQTRRSWSSGVRIAAYWNRQEEGQHEVRTKTPNLRTDLSDRQDVLGVNADVSWFPGDGTHRIVYGLDWSTETIHSGREDVDLRTGAVTPKRGTWTDGASYDTLALYAQDRFDLGSLVTLTLGGRYSRFASGGHESSSVGVLDLEASEDSLTGAVSAVLRPTSRVHLVGSLTYGFRAPNLDDISVLSERPEGVEVPNPDINPEKILGYEAGVKLGGPRFEASAFFYQNRLQDLLMRAPGMLNGLPYFDLNDNGRRDSSEPAVLQRLNLGRATITGVEADARWSPGRGFSLFGTFTHTVGDDTVADVPLARMPPNFGTAGARWTSASSRQPWVEAVYLFAGAQRRLAPADVADVRIGAGGTDAFHVVNLRGGVVLGPVRVGLGLENVGDEPFKYHGSGVYRPGRQVVVSTDVRF
jgi:outer membrane receptor protein involved in Fe transport